MPAVDSSTILTLIIEQKFNEALKECKEYLRQSTSHKSIKHYHVSVMKGYCLFKLNKYVKSIKIYEKIISQFEKTTEKDTRIPIEAYEGLASVYEEYWNSKNDKSAAIKLLSIYCQLLPYGKIKNDKKYVKYLQKIIKISTKIFNIEMMIEKFNEFCEFLNKGNDGEIENNYNMLMELYHEIYESVLTIFKIKFFNNNNVIMGKNSFCIWIQIYTWLMNFYKFLYSHSQILPNDNIVAISKSVSYDVLSFCKSTLTYLNGKWSNRNLEQHAIEEICISYASDINGSIKIDELIKNLNLDDTCLKYESFTEINHRQLINSCISLTIQCVYEAIHLFFNDYPDDPKILEVMFVFEMKKHLLSLQYSMIMKCPSHTFDTSFFNSCSQMINLKESLKIKIEYFNKQLLMVLSGKLPEINEIETICDDYCTVSYKFYLHYIYVVVLYHCNDYKGFISACNAYSEIINLYNTDETYTDVKEWNLFQAQFNLMKLFIYLKLGYIEEAHNLIVKQQDFMKLLPDDLSTCQAIMYTLTHSYNKAKDIISTKIENPLLKDYANLLLSFSSETMENISNMTILDYINDKFPLYFNIVNNPNFYIHSINFLNEQLCFHCLKSLNQKNIYEQFAMELLKKSPNSMALCFCVGSLFSNDSKCMKMMLKCYYRAYSLGYLHKTHIKTIVCAFVNAKLWDLVVDMIVECENSDFFYNEKAWIHSTLANIYLEKADISLAIHQLTKLVETESCSVEKFVQLAETFIHNASYTRAIQIANQIINHSNSSSAEVIYAHILIAKSHFKMRSYSVAITWFKKIMEFPSLSNIDKIQCQYGILECYLNLSQLLIAKKNIHCAREYIKKALDISFKLYDCCKNSDQLYSIAEIHAYCLIVASKLFINYNIVSDSSSKDDTELVLDPFGLAKKSIKVVKKNLCNTFSTLSYFSWFLFRCYLNAIDIIDIFHKNDELYLKKKEKYSRCCMDQIIICLLLNHENISAWNDLGCLLSYLDTDIRLTSSVFLVSMTMAQKEEFPTNAACNLAHCYLTHHSPKNAETLYNTVLTNSYKDMGAWMGKYLLTINSNLQQSDEAKFKAYGYLMRAIFSGFHKEVSINAIRFTLEIIYLQIISKNLLYFTVSMPLFSQTTPTNHITFERLNSVINDINAYMDLYPNSHSARYNSLLLKTITLGPKDTLLMIQKLPSEYLTFDLTLLAFYLCSIIPQHSQKVVTFAQNANKSSIEKSYNNCIIFALNFYKNELYDNAKYYFEKALELMPKYLQNYNSNVLQLKSIIWLCYCKAGATFDMAHALTLLNIQSMDIHSNCGTISYLVLIFLMDLIYNKKRNVSNDLICKTIEIVHKSDKKFHQFYASLPLIYYFKKTKRFKDFISLFFLNLQRFAENDFVQNIVSSSLNFIKSLNFCHKAFKIISSYPNIKINKNLMQTFILYDKFDNIEQSYNRLMSFIYRYSYNISSAILILIWLIRLSIKDINKFNSYATFFKDYLLKISKTPTFLDENDQSICYLNLLLIQCFVIAKDFTICNKIVEKLKTTHSNNPFVVIVPYYIKSFHSKGAKIDISNSLASDLCSIIDTNRETCRYVFDIYCFAALIEKNNLHIDDALIYYKNALSIKDLNYSQQRFVLFSIIELVCYQKSSTIIDQAKKALMAISNNWPLDDPTINYIILYLKLLTNDSSNIDEHYHRLSTEYIDQYLINYLKRYLDHIMNIL